MCVYIERDRRGVCIYFVYIRVNFVYTYTNMYIMREMRETREGRHTQSPQVSHPRCAWRRRVGCAGLGGEGLGDVE